MPIMPPKPQFGQRIVNGLLTMALTVGLTVNELTDGTMVANLGYDRVSHPNPVFHGDTIYVESEVLEKRESRSNPDRGVVRLRHIGRKPDGTVAVELERTVLFLKRSAHDGGKIMLRSRRALLYVPGDNLHMVEKAAALGADCVCLDIEDGVAFNRKADARAAIAGALPRLDFGRSEQLVRINPVGSGMEQEDLNSVLPSRPDGAGYPQSAQR